MVATLGGGATLLDGGKGPDCASGRLVEPTGFGLATEVARRPVAIWRARSMFPPWMVRRPTARPRTNATPMATLSTLTILRFPDIPHAPWPTLAPRCLEAPIGAIGAWTAKGGQNFG